MISPFLFALCVNELVRLLDELDCPGMCIDEAFSYFNLLMYPDNIALMNDTIGRLQNSIEIMSAFPIVSLRLPTVYTKPALGNLGQRWVT